MSNKNVILVLKYCILDRAIFGAIKSMITYELPYTLMHFTPYVLIFFATINGFWVFNDLDDQRMYNLTSDHQNR